jgi:hypothetical protein
MKKTYITAFVMILIVVVMILIEGCLDYKSVAIKENFHFMGVSAEPPELSPGDGVTIQVLWADPVGNDRKVSFAWLACVDDFLGPVKQVYSSRCSNVGLGFTPSRSPAGSNQRSGINPDPTMCKARPPVSDRFRFFRT